jgi:hypothetical protein
MEARMTVIEEIDDLLDALKHHTEGMPHGLRKNSSGTLRSLARGHLYRLEHSNGWPKNSKNSPASRDRGR